MDLELKFFTIQGHYGVWQAWMRKSSYVIQRSCGLAALLNVLIYEQVLSVKTIDQARFYLEELSTPILPRPWGIVRFSTLYQLFNRISPKKYRLVRLKGPFSLEKMAGFIQEGLGKNHPLLLLTFNHKSPSFHNHWVTITGIKKDKDDYTLVTSNWGQRRLYSLKDYLESPSLYRGLGYFEEG